MENYVLCGDRFLLKQFSKMSIRGIVFNPTFNQNNKIKIHSTNYSLWITLVHSTVIQVVVATGSHLCAYCVMWLKVSRRSRASEVSFPCRLCEITWQQRSLCMHTYTPVWVVNSAFLREECGKWRSYVERVVQIVEGRGWGHVLKPCQYRRKAPREDHAGGLNSGLPLLIRPEDGNLG